MYAGRIVEHGADGDDLRRARAPLHVGPAAVDPAPRRSASDEPLVPIPGRPPRLINAPDAAARSIPAARTCASRTSASSPELEPVPGAPGHTASPACSPRRDAHALWDAPAAPATRPSRRAPPCRRAGDASTGGAGMSAPGKPLVEVRDLVKHFPITHGIVFQKQVGAVHAVDGVSLRRAARRDARHRRRDGLRQDDDRAR